MPKFKAEDRVKSLNPFDKKKYGKVLGTAKSVIDKSLYYEVLLDGDGTSGLYREDELELMPETRKTTHGDI